VSDFKGGRITVVFEIRGSGTAWLAGRETGDSVDVIAPLGNGFDLPDGDIIVVGGGIGAAPMRFAAKSARGGVRSVLGFRSVDNIILRDKFESLGETVITTDDGSFGVHGNVTLPLRDMIADSVPAAILACGPRVMLHAVADIAAEFDIPCGVSLEERMGCGVGACLVCACKTLENDETHMRRVCKDGPVFDSREVVW
jgi:dihydroorotate dehydrogenase electron transfer subunit